MKVTFKYNIGTYSGTLNEMTYGRYRDGMVCIGRKWVVPAVTPQQTALVDVAKNLSVLYKSLSLEYKANLKTYALRYGAEHVPLSELPPTCYAIFIKIMYAYQKSAGLTVNLATLTKSDLSTLSAPVVTIKDTVEAGLLPTVTDYEALTDEM
ncbi:MAG TPA: hypothetical protein PKI15_05235 [Candidatus Cloacimonadota bacterium]|nr:hypothetical protein [Candidatus Cloacimonadota bacterium]